MSDSEEVSSTHDSKIILIPVLWQHALTFLDTRDVCSTGLVSHEFHRLSIHDLIWEPHCRKRWVGKQNIARFINNNQQQSWKQRYAWAEYDSRRQHITREEVSYFCWKLFYNGVPSKMGLRSFLPNGTYNSPYAGLCDWTLNDNHLSFMGVMLPIERDEATWGWIVGRGQRTEYHSIEKQDTTTTTG